MSSEQNPDKALERLLRQSFRTRTDKAGSGSCLDADTLAAWADGTLAAKDLAAAEAHASSCDRCLTLLAAMERVTPPAAVSKRWWSYGPMFRWLVPLTAAVTVVAVWIAVPRQDRPPPPVSADLSAVAPRGADAEAPRAAEAEVPSAKPDATGTGLASAKQIAESAARGTALASPKQMAESAAKVGARDRAAMAAPRQERGASRATSRDDAQSARREKASAPASEPEARELRKDGAANAAGERASMGGVAGVAGAPPAAPAVGPLSETIQTPAARSLARKAPVQVVSPNPLIRWRATGGFIERSTDGGTTWTPTPTQVAEDLTAGASPSPSVCWLVGSSGTVLLSTDGTQFRRVPFPERVDLTAVRAADPRNATVTTSDGRTFATADAGLTWLAKP